MTPNPGFKITEQGEYLKTVPFVQFIYLTSNVMCRWSVLTNLCIFTVTYLLTYLSHEQHQPMACVTPATLHRRSELLLSCYSHIVWTGL